MVTVDVTKRGDLAKKYGVALVPLAFPVRSDGTVTRTTRWSPDPAGSHSGP